MAVKRDWICVSNLKSRAKEVKLVMHKTADATGNLEKTILFYINIPEFPARILAEDP